MFKNTYGHIGRTVAGTTDDSHKRMIRSCLYSLRSHHSAAWRPRIHRCPRHSSVLSSQDKYRTMCSRWLESTIHNDTDSRSSDPSSPQDTLAHYNDNIYMFQQESRAVARKPRDATAVLFGLKFADKTTTFITSLRVAMQASKPGFRAPNIPAQNRI